MSREAYLTAVLLNLFVWAVRMKYSIEGEAETEIGPSCVCRFNGLFITKLNSEIRILSFIFLGLKPYRDF